MKRDERTDAVEDYLKVIYDVQSSQGRATTNQIAERLDITAASVTGMLRKLATTDPPMIQYRKHYGAVLTREGEAVALEVIRHHRLLELFLQEALGYSWDEVHGEADRLEHVISEEMEERIAQILGDPERDPHGEPIPTRDFRLPDQSWRRLSELRTGERACIERVEADDPDLLRYLADLKLLPGRYIEVVGYVPFDGNLEVIVAGEDEPVVVGPAVSRRIFVGER